MLKDKVKAEAGEQVAQFLHFFSLLTNTHTMDQSNRGATTYSVVRLTVLFVE